MALWILFGLCLVVQVICVPWYLKALWPQKCRKSLILKMICSTMFVGIGILSMHLSGNFSSYAITMLIGLVLGWIGDYFLHAKPTNTYFAIGFTSFLIGHFFYIGAYLKALPKLFPDYEMVNAVEIIIGVIILASALISAKVLKINFSPKPLKYAIAVYFTVITFMFLKASALGFNYWQSGGENGIVCFALLCTGSFFFVLSDATLGVLSFGGRKNYPLKIFNIITYFGGQTMLASSILFINS